MDNTLIQTTMLVVVVVGAALSVDATEDKLAKHFKWERPLSTFNIGERPNGRKCHDFCAMMAEMCRNGGTCVTDEVTCAGKCICRTGWTGKWCKESVTDVFRDETNTASDKQKADATKTPADETDDIMRNSSIIDLNLRPLLPQDNSTSSFVIANVLNLSNISSPNTPNISQDDKINPTVTIHEFLVPGVSIANEPNDTFSPVKTQNRDKCLKECILGDCYDADGFYYCKQRVNVSELTAPRSCLPGFVCKHGVCDMDALKNKTYKCLCESNYVGTFCEMECPFDCGEHGYCDYHVEDVHFTCVCQWKYTGVNCTELRPIPPGADPVVFHWYVVGICAGIVAAVLTVLAVVPYVMWRKRMVFILKIVHYFQQCEDDDGKEYDAFVSYKSTPRDEKFVLQHLYPRLETKLRLKLCLHFRDFLPGEAIANNIVRAIENSRRTIMILSPAYVKSEWCRMEYQKAQHEMLKLKHKIIPIVLEDISTVTNIDKNLQNIISSVTYLEWPGKDDAKRLERFWTKLELSMPKKSTSGSSSSSGSRGMHSSVSSPAIVSSSVPESTDFTTDAVSSESFPSHGNISIIDPVAKHKSTRIKKRDLKHFMGRLVSSKLFNRQDSTSSEAALVDDDTAASRSSCDSLSETMTTDSDSACSTPHVVHTYIDEAGTCVNGPNSQETRKELRHSACEKDHCEFSPCTNCTELNTLKSNSQEYINMGFNSAEHESDSLICEHCLRVLSNSDNNRVKISHVKGSNALKITKLPLSNNTCPNCLEQLSKCNLEYCGSVKMRKEVVNRTLVRHNRNGSLPWDYKRSSDQDKTPANDVTTQNSSIFIDVYENI